MIEREQVNVQPDKTLMRKLGLGGYSFPQAIGEFIDNSIDARIDGKRLHIQVQLDSDAIAITDDGTGMEPATLKSALRLAYSEKEGKLGEFGLGLKTAATSLGKRFDVWTSTAGDRQKFHMWYDEDEWEMGPPDQWMLPFETEPKDDPRGHGTLVRIGRLIITTRSRVTGLRNDLAHRFAPYIQSGQVEIKVNRKKSSYTQPDLIEGSRRTFEIEVRGYRIHGWSGLLEHGSQKGLYGFHTYRRGRMITTYDKIGIPEHPTMARIVGEINLDHVPVTNNKREFIKESREYQEAVEALEEEFQGLIKRARQAAVPDRLTKKVKEELHAWKDWVQEALTSPELAQYALPAGAAFEPVDPLEIPASTPREVDVELRAPPTEQSRGPIELRGERERTPRETHLARRHTIRIKGKKFDYIHDFRPLGLESPWKEFAVNEDQRLIEIFTNTDFPSYHTTKDVVFYAIIHIAESLAEIMVTHGGDGKEKVDEVKESILRAASKIANRVQAQRVI